MKTICLVACLFIFASCSKEEPSCTWSYGILNGRTYQVAAFYIDRVDIIDFLKKSNPCIYNRDIIYREGYYTFSADTNCPKDTVEYNTYVSDGVKYYSEAGARFRVTTFDCKQFSIYRESFGHTYEITFVSK